MFEIRKLTAAVQTLVARVSALEGYQTRIQYLEEEHKLTVGRFTTMEALLCLLQKQQVEQRSSLRDAQGSLSEDIPPRMKQQGSELDSQSQLIGELDVLVRQVVSEVASLKVVMAGRGIISLT